ncbi:MAG: ABC transporter ATP-binding protein [Beijerinckiaceae bacterium]|nr:ABC transporter ATP-binding protein [Beijerinckiaceae bacterium]
MGPERIRLAGITKAFGALKANDHVDLTLHAGEIHALLGENGAGKSTLMKILYGLLRPDSGEIRINGQRVTLPSPRAARAQGIGMVFQHFSLFEDFTALENIAIPLDGRTADATLRAEVEAKARHFGLAIALDRPVHTLSAGERQRIEILRALMQEPQVLILDEPTSVLTPDEAEALFATLETLAAEGAGILFISHKLEEVRRLCSRATILRGGKVVAETDPRAVSAADLAALMVGEGVLDLRPVAEHALGEPLLELHGLSVATEGVHGVTLRDIDLTVRAGEVVAIAGVAGNGQSELYAAMSGEGGRVLSGEIRIAGQDVTRRDINARRMLGAAFVPEARLGQATLPQGPLSENVILSWHATGSLGRWLLDTVRTGAVARKVIERFDVRTPSPDPQAAQLSGGNLQKYVVGREIERQPRLMIVDQPSWGVDARAATHIRQTLLDLAASGAAVLVISQDLDEAMAMADRIAVMHGGHLSAARPVPALSRAEIGLLMVQGENAARGAA